METQDELTADVSDSIHGGSRSPRLFIKEMVMRNFKSYAGEQRVGPFHKVGDFLFLFVDSNFRTLIYFCIIRTLNFCFNAK